MAGNDVIVLQGQRSAECSTDSGRLDEWVDKPSNAQQSFRRRGTQVKHLAPVAGAARVRWGEHRPDHCCTSSQLLRVRWDSERAIFASSQLDYTMSVTHLP